MIRWLRAARSSGEMVSMAGLGYCVAGDGLNAGIARDFTHESEGPSKPEVST